MFYKTLSMFVGANLALYGLFMAFEPQIASAVTDEVVVTQTVTSGISITSPADASMSRALTVSANTAVGSATWNVKTNNATGYTLTVKSAPSSACLDRGSDGFKDTLCNPANGKAFKDLATTTPALWATPTTYVFGFSASGGDVNTSTYGTDADCVAGSADTPSAALKYRGFATSTEFQIASKSSETTVAGSDTILCLAVEQATEFAPSGTYTATTTATAVTQ